MIRQLAIVVIVTHHNSDFKFLPENVILVFGRKSIFCRKNMFFMILGKENATFTVSMGIKNYGIIKGI